MFVPLRRNGCDALSTRRATTTRARAGRPAGAGRAAAVEVQVCRLVSPSRRKVVETVCSKLGVSERRACQVLGEPRSTPRRVLRVADEGERLTAAIIVQAMLYSRCGCRRITALLRASGWLVNKRRVERIWRREGLKVPRRQPKKGRLWLNDGSCVRLRPERANQFWA